MDDPGDEVRRAELLDVTKRLVVGGAELPDQQVLAEAQGILNAQFPDGIPAVMDPFCGGGSTLVEAERLGIAGFGSDLNPVPVLITRALTETLPRVFRGSRHTLSKSNQGAEMDAGSRSDGTAESGQRTPLRRVLRDVAYYADLILEKALSELEAATQWNRETPIAWICSTAKCPNPACDRDGTRWCYRSARVTSPGSTRTR